MHLDILNDGGNFLFRIQYGSRRYASFLSVLGSLLVAITITDQTSLEVWILEMMASSILCDRMTPCMDDE